MESEVFYAGTFDHPLPVAVEATYRVLLTLSVSEEMQTADPATKALCTLPCCDQGIAPGVDNRSAQSFRFRRVSPL